MLECNNRILADNDLCQLRPDIPRPKRASLETMFSSEYFKEILLSYIFGPSVVKYDILSNNRRNELHTVKDRQISLISFYAKRRRLADRSFVLKFSAVGK